MKCIKAREVIYMSSESEPFSAEIIEVKEHLKNCPSCAEFFKEEEILKNIIHEKAPRERAPQSLKQLVLAITEKERVFLTRSAGTSSSTRLSGMISKLSFALLFLIFVTSSLILYNVSFQERNDSLSSILIEDHMKNIPGHVQILSSDPAAVEQWFSGKVDFVVNVPRLQGARFIGGRLCQIEGRRVALLFYEKNGKPLSLFVMDGSLADLNWKDKNVIETDGNFSEISNEKGCNIIFWREKGIVFALVSDIEKQEILKIIPGKSI